MESFVTNHLAVTTWDWYYSIEWYNNQQLHAEGLKKNILYAYKSNKIRGQQVAIQETLTKVIELKVCTSYPIKH